MHVICERLLANKRLAKPTVVDEPGTAKGMVHGLGTADMTAKASVYSEPWILSAIVLALSV